MTVKQELIGILKFRPVRLAAWVLLVVGVGTECFITKLSVLDLDMWWHLSAGDWIVQHQAFPHTGILSRTAADRPWMAYSWGYEVLLSRAYAWLGFLGMGEPARAVYLRIVCHGAINSDNSSSAAGDFAAHLS